MKKKLILILIIIVSITIITLIIKRINKPTLNLEKKTVKYISATVGVKLRMSPDTNSQVIEHIPFMESVEIFKEQNEELYISKRYGKWCYVSWKDKKGWVFSGFLCEFNIKSIHEVILSYYNKLYKSKEWYLCGEKQIIVNTKDIQLVDIFQNYIVLKIPGSDLSGGACNGIGFLNIIWTYDNTTNKFSKFYDFEDFSRSNRSLLFHPYLLYLNDDKKIDLIIIEGTSGYDLLYVITDLNKKIVLDDDKAFICVLNNEPIIFDRCDKFRLKSLDDYKNISEYTFDCKTEKLVKIDK